MAGTPPIIRCRSSTNEDYCNPSISHVGRPPSSDELLGIQISSEEEEEEEEDTTPRIPSHCLLRIPNTAFGIAMGLAGNAITWNTISNSDVFNQQSANTEIVNGVLWLAGLVVAAAVFICYAYKALFHYELVRQEWNHPVRVHFMNAPHLLVLMLTLGVPPRFGITQTTRQIIFGVCLAMQTFHTQFIYENWLFNPDSTISKAKPPFLLSTVGWFLLTNLGLQANIEESWGLALPQFCLGIGVMFYLMVALAILNSLHQNRKQWRGSPSLTLLLAPPSVSVIAFDQLDGDPTRFNTFAAMILGWILALCVLFLKIGPRIAQHPGVLGEYWAYVFPYAAAATAWIHYASVTNTTASTVCAAIFLSISIVALVAVLGRMLLHCYHCARNQAQWGDPLLKISSSVDASPETQSASTAPLYTNPV